MTMEERIKQGLDTVFDGANNRYSIFYIFNATREEVERVIVELTHVGYFLHGVSTFETSYNGVMDGVFAFVGWKESPSAVHALSCRLPEKLCIGETSWDYFSVEIYKNGLEAVKERDYTFDLQYESSDEDGYYDTHYRFSDGERYVVTGAGMVLEGQFEEVRTMATSKRSPINWDLWKEEK